LPTLNQNFSIPVKAITGTTGSYQIAANDLQNLPSGACINLHDTYLNTDWNLRTGPYSCTLTDTETVPRFVLNITIDPNLSVSSSFKNPTCSSAGNGYMVATASGTAPWNYYWKDSANNIIQTSLSDSGPDTLKNVNAGNYSVDINTGGTCNNGTVQFTLQGEASPNALYTASSTTVALVNDTATVSFTNNSANANAYLWNFGDGTVSSNSNISHQYTNPGTYIVTLNAYNSVCGDSSQYSQVITIDSVLFTTGIKSFTTNQNSLQISRDGGGYYVQFNCGAKTNAVISVQNLLGERVVADVQQDNVQNNKTYVSLGSIDNNVLIISVITSAGEKTFRKVINY
jgi:PKD repeat protein